MNPVTLDRESIRVLKDTADTLSARYQNANTKLIVAESQARDARLAVDRYAERHGAVAATLRAAGEHVDNLPPFRTKTE